MLNLESLNYLNQNQTIKTDLQNTTSNKIKDLRLDNKDFKSYLTKEKELNNKKMVEKPVEEKVIVEEKEETEPLNINKEVSEKINDSVEVIEDDSKGNIEGVLLALTSLFNNINIENINGENIDFGNISVEDIEALLTSSFNELKSIIFSNTNENKENINLLNSISPSNVDITNLESKSYKDLLININELLNEGIKIIDGNEGITPNVSLGTVENELKNSIAELFNTLDSNEFKNVVSEIGEDDKYNLLNTIKTLLNNEKNKETSVKEFTLPVKEKAIEANNLFKSEVSQENSFESFEDSSYLKEEKVLSKVINNVSENKFSNVLTTSYDRFNNITTKIEQVPVYKETMNADIIQNVKYMVNNKLEELTVKIYPKELGEITIKILSEEGIIRADIKATSKETYALLNSNIQEIKNSLSNQNIKIQEVNIGLYNEDTTFFSNGESNSKEAEKGKYSNGKIGNIDLIEDIIEEELSNNSVNMLA